MSRKDPAVILDPVVPFDDRKTKVSDLCHCGNGNTRKRKEQDIYFHIRLQMLDDDPVNHHRGNAEYNASDASLHRFLGADLRSQLMFAAAAEKHPAEIGKCIGDPRADENEQINVFSLVSCGEIVDVQDPGKTDQDIEQTHIRHSDFRRLITSARKDLHGKQIQDGYGRRSKTDAERQRKVIVTQVTQKERQPRRAEIERNRYGNRFFQPDAGEHLIDGENRADGKSDRQQYRIRKNQNRNQNANRHKGGDDPLFHKANPQPGQTPP